MSALIRRVDLSGRELWDAFPKDAAWTCAPGGRRTTGLPGAGGEPVRTIQGAAIVALLLGANVTQPGAVACLRLAGARISGRLNLAGAQIEHALWIEECWFERAVDLLGASTRTVVMTGCGVPGVEADSARIEGNLDLRRSVVESLASTPVGNISTALSLSDARVAGGMLLNGAHISAPGGLAVAAGGLVMEGGVQCNRCFVARGGVRLVGARLPRGLYMRGLAKQRHRRRALSWPARAGATCSTRPSATATAPGRPASGSSR